MVCFIFQLGSGDGDIELATETLKPCLNDHPQVKQIHFFKIIILPLYILFDYNFLCVWYRKVNCLKYLKWFEWIYFCFSEIKVFKNWNFFCILSCCFIFFHIGSLVFVFRWSYWGGERKHWWCKFLIPLWYFYPL